MLHGYLADSNSFVYQKQFFERYFKVYAPDFKGFGSNVGMEYPYSLDDYSRDLVNFIKTNGLEKPHVIAHSFGARVVLKTLGKYPELFDKLVITGGAGLKPRTTPVKFIKKTAFKVLKPLLGKDRLKSFYSADYQRLAPVMQESFKMVVGETFDKELPKIENQTLLIFGDKDKETPLYMAKRFHKGLKNSRLSVYSGAGHFCFLDCPLKFNTEVREFLLSE